MVEYTVACLPCIDGLLADKFLNGNVITFDKRNSAPLYRREFKNNPQVVLVVEIADAFKCYIIASCDAEGKKLILSGNKYHFLLQMKKKCLKDKMAQKKMRSTKTHLPDPANGFASFVFL